MVSGSSESWGAVNSGPGIQGRWIQRLAPGPPDCQNIFPERVFLKAGSVVPWRRVDAGVTGSMGLGAVTQGLGNPQYGGSRRDPGPPHS